MEKVYRLPGISCPKCGLRQIYHVKDDYLEDDLDSVIVHYECKSCGYKTKRRI